MSKLENHEKRLEMWKALNLETNKNYEPWVINLKLIASEIR